MIKDSAVSFVKLAPSFPFDYIKLENATFGKASSEFRTKISRLFYIQNIYIQSAYELIHLPVLL